MGLLLILRPQKRNRQLKTHSISKHTYAALHTAVSILALFAIVSSGCKPAPKEAADYNGKIVTEQRLILQKFKVLDASLQRFVPEEMDSAYAATLKQVQSSIQKTKNLEPFDGSTEFRDASLNIFAMHEEMLKNEYRELITILKKSEVDYTYEDEQRGNKLLLSIIDKQKNANEDIIAIQAAFAEKYHITLESKPSGE